MTNFRTVYDIEVYPNYFLAVFYDIDKKEFIHFTEENLKELKEYVKNVSWLIGYNSIDYDNIIISSILNSTCKTVSDIKILNDKLIDDNDNFSNTKVYKKLKYYNLPFKSIDLSYYFPKTLDKFVSKKEGENKKYIRAFTSLKELQANLDFPNIKNLPYSPDKSLTDKQKKEVYKYCENDVISTYKLYDISKTQIKLRYNLGEKYINMTEAKLGEQYVLDKYIEKTQLTKNQVYELKQQNIKEVKLKLPQNIEFKNLEIKEWYQARLKETLQVNKDGNLELEGLKKIVSIDGLEISLGGGGLHACKSGKYESIEDYKIIDIDVASYYPKIIINNELYPKHLGKTFLELYKELVQSRLEAKSLQDNIKASSLKIVILAMFGKLGNAYAWFYNPSLFPSITVTGELYIINLIERLSFAGIEIIYANTDGITAKVKKEDIEKFRKIYTKWEKDLNLSLEENIFSKLYLKDVSNYIGIKENGEYKQKGKAFTSFNSSILGKSQKRNNYPIAIEATIKYLIDNIPIEETIYNCKDLYKFRLVSVSSYKMFNASNSGKLPKVIRYYVSNDFDNGLTLFSIPKRNESKFIKRIEKGEKQDTLFEGIKKEDSYLNNKLGSKKLEGGINAKLFLEYPEKFPNDIDYKFYIEKAKTSLQKIENEGNNKKDIKVLHEQKKATRELKTTPERKSKTRAETKTECKTDNPLDLLLDGNKIYAVTIKGQDLNKPYLYLSKKEILEGNNKFEYVCYNPLKSNEERTKENIEEINTIVIESDLEKEKITPENIKKSKRQQIKSIEHLGFSSVIVDSGGKSLHNIIRFESPITGENFIYLAELIKKVYIVPQDSSLDSKVLMNSATLSRLANGTRKNGTIQRAKIINPVPIKYEEMKVNLESRVSKQTLERLNNSFNEERLPINEEKFKFVYNVIAPILKEKGFTNARKNRLDKFYRNHDGIYFITECPFKEFHSKPSKKTDFSFYLEDTGIIKANCFHESCSEKRQEVGKKGLLKLFGIDIYKIYESFIKNEEKKKELDEKYKSLEREAKSEHTDYKISVYEAIKRNVEERKVLSLEASTGVGKTVSSAILSKELIEKNESVLFATTDKTLMESFFKKCIKVGIKRENILILDTDTIETLEEIQHYPIIITHFEYFRTKGDSFSLYNKVVPLIDDRHVFIDECDKFLNIKQYQLCQMYTLDFDVYRRLSFCKKAVGNKGLVRSKNNEPCNCVRVYKQSERIEHYNIKKYYPNEIPKIAIKEYSEFSEFGEWMQKAFNFGLYIQTDKHRFTQEIPENLKPKDTYFKEISKHKITESSKNLFLSILINHLYNPQFKVYFPLDDKTPVEPENYSSEDLEGLKYSKPPCMCPVLEGYEMTPLFILNGVKLGDFQYSGAKSITFMTATKNNILDSACKKTFKERFHTIKIEDIKAKFDIDILKTTKSFSIGTFKEIIKHFADIEPKNIIIFCKTKNEAVELYNKVYTRIDNKEVLQLFDRRDYNRNFKSRSKEVGNTQILISYLGANNARGEDFPEFELIFINCNGFIPEFNVFIDNISSKTEKIIHNLQMEFIEGRLNQVSGRILRTLLEYKKEGVVYDNISKTIVMYNLPQDLLGFEIDEKLLYEYRSYKESWIKNKTDFESIISQVKNSLSRLEIIDFSNNKKEIKETIEDKLVKLANKGIGWTEIYNKLNIKRQNKNIQRKLKKLYKAISYNS